MVRYGIIIKPYKNGLVLNWIPFVVEERTEVVSLFSILRTVIESNFAERWKERETNEPPSQPPPNKTRQSETKLRE